MSTLQCTFLRYLRNQHDCTPTAAPTAVDHEGTSALPKTVDTLATFTTGHEDTFQSSREYAPFKYSPRSDSEKAMFEAFSRFHAQYVKGSIMDNSESSPVEDSSEGYGLSDSASDSLHSNRQDFQTDVAQSDVLQVVDQ